MKVKSTVDVSNIKNFSNDSTWRLQPEPKSNRGRKSSAAVQERHRLEAEDEVRASSDAPDDLQNQQVASKLEKQIEDSAVQLGKIAVARGVLCATAESCTAGGTAYAITSVAGSSAWFDRGFVTYTNEAKHELIDVNLETLAQFGAVSEQTAREMAIGTLNKAPKATLSVSITGIAGPGGAVPGKPVGTVCFGFARREAESIVVETTTQHFDGDRREVRLQSMLFAINGLIAEAAKLKR